MPYIHEQLRLTGYFIDQGGYPLWAILIISVTIFVLFFERWLFLNYVFPKHLIRWQQSWETRLDKQSWSAQRIRDALIAQGNAYLNQYKWLLKVAIAVCPLLGLMGTVSGMVLVFDELAFFGTGNPRIMSAGIFKATIPTMAGMLVAIIGLILQRIILRLSLHKQHSLMQSMKLVTGNPDKNNLNKNDQEGASA